MVLRILGRQNQTINSRSSSTIHRQRLRSQTLTRRDNSTIISHRLHMLERNTQVPTLHPRHHPSSSSITIRIISITNLVQVTITLPLANPQRHSLHIKMEPTSNLRCIHKLLIISNLLFSQGPRLQESARGLSIP